ncbi:MAG: hypothetical protein H7A33_01945 [Deltaproteobacteria bacterium]|nr:hypothetical protein [Deltaproteobacteria bacterium]
MVTEILTHSAALDEFFREKIQEALNTQKIKVSTEAQIYLVNILTHFSKSENFFQTNADGKKELRPLALKLYDAVFSEAHNEKFLHLKSLGDTALYHAGVFYDAIHSGILDIEYYIQMGGSAYQSLANLSTTQRDGFGDLYDELSRKFAQLVEVLYLSCEQEMTANDNDLLRVLDRYIKTGSQKAKEILEENGILPEHLKTDKKAMQ